MIAAASSRRASFSALASANSFVYFASSAATSRWHLHVSNCRVRQLQFSGIFVALGFVGNGVIRDDVNSPWQADDDADSQSGDNREWLCSPSSLWPFRPLLWILQSGCQPYARTDQPAPGSEAQILLQRSIAWRISPRSIIGKAPRSLICCNATASWLFGEKSFRPSCLR